LTREERDSRLLSLGLKKETLEGIRSKAPRDKILEAARVALTIDEEPNSDLIEYIAGYAPRSAVYHLFRSLKDLIDCLGTRQAPSLPAAVYSSPAALDLVSVLPPRIGAYAVHVEDVGSGRQVNVWQKVNGGMRSAVLNRSVNRLTFLTGVVLYAGEGTKSLKSGRVELANSNPGILRLHVRFMEELGLPLARLRARFQIHHPEEELEAKNLWTKEVGLAPQQFVKPLLRPPSERVRRRTFTLQLNYPNMMLLFLLRHWTATLEDLVQTLDRQGLAAASSQDRKLSCF
jgi:hypothetical protein